MDFLSALIPGAVVALVATLLMRGKSRLPWWGAWLAGIAGALGGYQLAAQLGVAQTAGIDWIRWALSVVVAMVVIAIAAAVFRKKR